MGLSDDAKKDQSLIRAHLKQHIFGVREKHVKALADELTQSDLADIDNICERLLDEGFDGEAVKQAGGHIRDQVIQYPGLVHVPFFGKARVTQDLFG